jgi:preprotein translocase subunit SecD
LRVQKGGAWYEGSYAPSSRLMEHLRLHPNAPRIARALALVVLVMSAACGVERYTERAPASGLAVFLADYAASDAQVLRDERGAEYRIAPRPAVPTPNIRHVRLLDAADGSRVLVLDLDDVGRERLASASAEHIGKRLAIVHGGRVVAAPRVREPLVDGEAHIRVSDGELESTFDRLTVH